MKLLKERIIPALILLVVSLGIVIPLSIFSPIYYESRIITLVFISFITAIFSYEFFKAMRLKNIFIYLLTLSLVASIVFPLTNLIQIHQNNFQQPFDTRQIIIFIQNIAQSWETIIIILTVSLIFFIIEKVTRKLTFNDLLLRTFYVLFTSYLFSIVMKSFMIFLDFDYKLWLIPLAIAISYDTGGFFAGKYLGKKIIKKSFAPIISPNKTWEGFIFGSLIAIIIASVLTFSLNLFQMHNYSLIKQIIFVLLAPLIAAIGDLYFSLIKRLNGIKDYSKILLGHGGFLDRFDSILFILFFIFIICMF
ncbi:phosphatidate cytidylyltransferase [Mycoplasma sp. 1018B]|uniref:phosphatidate cytidylyltransferase n=1 Tax=Mycoplasma sp. 1018B TaxID=2967302 RepID=UPI00211CFF64|nr:phosphatidate cytidylyltransferase [Mycoplasma sp. 1018B]UUM19321.1 phosphatidate cytidylyltransferase [Mycoplasma sp. 1018B]